MSIKSTSAQKAEKQPKPSGTASGHIMHSLLTSALAGNFNTHSK